MKLDAQFVFNVVCPYMLEKMVNGLSCQMKSIAVTILSSWCIDVLYIFLLTLEKNISKFMGLMNHTVKKTISFHWRAHIFISILDLNMHSKRWRKEQVVASVDIYHFCYRNTIFCALFHLLIRLMRMINKYCLRLSTT